MTKSRVVRVCCSWREFGTPLLLEHIAVSRPRQISLVLVALFGDGRSHPGSISLGQLIKRIDVLHSRCLESQESGEAINRILRHAPNLVILTMNRAPWYSCSPLDVLFTPTAGTIVSPNLQYLCLVDLSGPMFTQQQYFSFVEAHPQLRYVDGTPIVLQRPAFNAGKSQTNRPSYPSVREVQFRSFSTVDAGTVEHHVCPPIDTLRNLETIIVPCMIEVLSALESILSHHGKTLRSLRLVRIDKLLIAFPSRNPDHVKLIQDYCPRLQELTFSVFNATQFPNLLNSEAQVLLPEVDTLGVEIRPRRGQFSKAEFRELLNNVSSWKGRAWAPKLRTIRFVSESNIVHIRQCYGRLFGAFLQECSSSGVQVEGPFCEPLNIPSHYAPSSS